MPLLPLRELIMIVVYFGLMAFGIWLFRTVRTKRAIIRISVRTLSVVLIALNSLAVCIIGCGALLTTISAPIYSPDRGHALRVEDHDEGAVGGETNVDLYSKFGMHQDTIFSSEWRSAEPKDISWLNDHEILIQYHAPVLPNTCASAQNVTVHCQRAPESIH